MIDLDEIIYHKLLKLVRKYKDKESQEVTDKKVILKEISGKLTILARAITGEEISIYPSKREGGYRDYLYFMPELFHRYESLELNLKYYMFRTFYLSAQCLLDHQYKAGEEVDKKQLIGKSISESVKVLEYLFDEYPAIEPVYNLLLEAETEAKKNDKKSPNVNYLYGRWMKSSKSYKANTTPPTDENNSKQQEAEITTEIDSNPVEEIETIAVNKKAQEDYVLTHNFEKVETADEFNGVWRNFDGEDELSDHTEALSELDMKYTVRADDAVHSVYKAELAPNSNSIEAGAGETTDIHYHYDEWDYKNKNYRKDYCRVFYSEINKSARKFGSQVLSDNSKTISELRKMFARIHNELEKVNRSTHGEDIDFDAAIDAYGDMHAKRTPDERLYIAKKRQRKDLSVLILMDTSLSADSYTEGRKILDIEKQALVCFGEVLNEYNIDFQIDTFNSRTRNFCYYKSVKKFDEDWKKTRNKIGALAAESYTRIGPALRHAGSELDKSNHTKKWIVLLTDGKASDYDKYEGKQGTEDIKKAIEELSNRGIYTFALAVESKAKYYLPQMFGHRNYEVLPHIEQLPAALGEFYTKITMS